jgi:hypothetical protein
MVYRTRSPMRYRIEASRWNHAMLQQRTAKRNSGAGTAAGFLLSSAKNFGVASRPPRVYSLRLLFAA